MSASSSRSIGQWFACLAAALSLTSWTGTVCGQRTVEWGNANGGGYVIPNNWVGGVVPGALDTALFNLDRSYNVSFPNSTTSAMGLTVGDGSVTFTTAGISGSPVYSIAADATIGFGELTLASGTPKLSVQVGERLDVNRGGILNVTAGSDLDADALSIADDGTINVVGSGSTFDVLGIGPALVGASGAGALNISSGGDFSSADVFRLGDAASSRGILTVSGAGSTWTSNDELRVGNSGAGTLDITFGGVVTNIIGVIANANGSSGAVTVNGAGSAWTNGDFLIVGSSGTATLEIAAGGTVTNTFGDIGQDLDSNGTVTVTGGGSTWTNSGDLRVAKEGTGTLMIEAGGAVSNQLGIIGDLVDSSGSATVAGDGSTWTNTGSLVVGKDGAGTLEINDGGAVTDANGVIGDSTGSSGTVTVSGAGSTWTSNTGTNGFFLVGNNGQGTLNIEDGGSVSNFTGAIGNFADSVGAVTVSGAGSSWNNTGDVVVGFSGQGTLDITDGAQVTSTLHSIFGDSIGSNGTVNVSGFGSTLTNLDELRVGNSGTATLSVTEGGEVTSAKSWVGFEAGSNGDVTVSGPGATWTNSSGLTVGNDGTGMLTIEAEGSVSNDVGFIGGGADGTGSATVTGAGSTWSNSGDLTVGYSGRGSLTIEAGGTVSNGRSIIGFDSQSVGTATVSGAGSTWTNNGSLEVGAFGTGTLTIQAGGGVSSGAGFIGLVPGSTGTVTVTGAGSTWNSGNRLDVGGGPGGTATLSVHSGAMVEVDGALTIWNDGTVNLLGGTIVADELAMPSSTFNFLLGTLRLTSDQTIAAGNDLAKAIGDTPMLTAGKHLTIDGVATLLTPLTLDGGTLSVGQLVNAPLLELRRGTLNIADQALSVEAGGLFGDRLELPANVILNVDQGVTNHGLILGSGMLGGPLVNAAGGEIRAEAGDTLTFTGATANNNGDVTLSGGTVDFQGPLTNAAAGRITGRGTLIARAGLVNHGHVALAAGITDFRGDVVSDTNNTAVGITVSGNADAVFWGDVTNTSGLLRVSAGSSATFFGGFAGAGISGGGDVFFEADITPGSSPGLAEFGGNVHFGELASLEIEITGTTKGSEYDALDIAGTATLDGILGVSLLGSFTPAAGDVFEIISAASGITGTFADAILPALAGNLFWNVNYGANSVMLEVAAPGLEGDYNGNGIVDAADYTVWRDQLGSATALPNDDSPGVGQDDYDRWKTNFGAVADSGAVSSAPFAGASVPEPGTLTLLFCALMAFGHRLALPRRAACTRVCQGGG